VNQSEDAWYGAAVGAREGSWPGVSVNDGAWMQHNEEVALKPGEGAHRCGARLDSQDGVSQARSLAFKQPGSTSAVTGEYAKPRA
jgi:hypothetical protein